MELNDKNTSFFFSSADPQAKKKQETINHMHGTAQSGEQKNDEFLEIKFK